MNREFGVSIGNECFIRRLGTQSATWPSRGRRPSAGQQYGNHTKTELRLLGVTGFLHTAGWHHAYAAQRKEMCEAYRRRSRAVWSAVAPGRLELRVNIVKGLRTRRGPKCVYLDFGWKKNERRDERLSWDWAIRSRSMPTRATTSALRVCGSWRSAWA